MIRTAAFAAGLWVLSGLAAALAGADRVEALLLRAQPPAGVVFEIVSGREDELGRALPRVAAHARRLRARFPGLDIAVVTHGSEQFALLTGARGSFEAVHSLVETLGAREAIPVHVCATHASWRDQAPEDFPDYVDVAESASSKLADYEALGYERIRL